MSPFSLLLKFDVASRQVNGSAALAYAMTTETRAEALRTAIFKAA
jgi:hypothetical protein